MSLIIEYNFITSKTYIIYYNSIYFTESCPNILWTHSMHEHVLYNIYTLCLFIIQKYMPGNDYLFDEIN